MHAKCNFASVLNQIFLILQKLTEIKLVMKVLLFFFPFFIRYMFPYFLFMKYSQCACSAALVQNRARSFYIILIITDNYFRFRVRNVLVYSVNLVAFS